MADPTDEIERIRALLATNDGAVPFDVARTLLAALDAKSAEVERLRGERDQARRKAIEEAAAACHPTDCHCADDVRALLDPDAP